MSLVANITTLAGRVAAEFNAVNARISRLETRYVASNPNAATIADTTYQDHVVLSFSAPETMSLKIEANCIVGIPTGINRSAEVQMELTTTAGTSVLWSISREPKDITDRISIRYVKAADVPVGAVTLKLQIRAENSSRPVEVDDANIFVSRFESL